MHRWWTMWRKPAQAAPRAPRLRQRRGEIAVTGVWDGGAGTLGTAVSTGTVASPWLVLIGNLPRWTLDARGRSLCLIQQPGMYASLGLTIATEPRHIQTLGKNCNTRMVEHIWVQTSLGILLHFHFSLSSNWVNALWPGFPAPSC
jgi:hypothetical protein